MSSRVKELYDQIRDENIRKYGTQVTVYGPMLLGNLYSERTHFIFELLQNAEDACERAKKAGKERKFSLRFRLFPDRLEAVNNGIQFNDNDVRGICGIVESTKDQNITQIGKFGIGFKSVYAYTVSPRVFSGDHSFSIRNLVQPYFEERKTPIENDNTVFIIPFDKPEVKPETAFNEINKKLSNLGVRPMLFLNNIEEISFKTGSIESRYSRSSRKEGARTFVTLRNFENGVQKNKEDWLVFEKQLGNSSKQSIKIAYQFSTDQKTGKNKIVPADGALLFVYFPTEKETHLKFIIHGPFNTTPARDNIKQTDVTNLWLIEQFGDFVAENMLTIKELNLLDVDFLNTLPIDTDHFAVRESIFRPIYEKVKDKLQSNVALLPTYNKGYATVQQALLARSEDMRKLVSSQQLDYLFDKESSQWLDSAITENRTPELWKYLTCTLLVKEVDSETFARLLSESFFSRQTDAWLIQFYEFLGEQRALWRESEYGERPGILRSKPIIRLEDNSHKPPFDILNKPNVYLPSKDPATNQQYHNIVKGTIASDKRARAFLKELGIDEPDIVARIINIILPTYRNKMPIKESENLLHFQLIMKSLSECSANKREVLLTEMRKTPFLKAINSGSKSSDYKTPREIHLGSKYTGRIGAEEYFAGNSSAWFLNDRYLNCEDSQNTVKRLKEIGCADGISVSYKEPDYLNHVIISDDPGYHVRGLNGFDPDCELEGLKFALENININRAVVIWGIAKQLNGNICGEIERSSRRDYQETRRTFQYSTMGQLLNEARWLPDKNDKFLKPSEIRLSDLSDELEKDSSIAKATAEKLGFKQETNEQIKKLWEIAPEGIKELLDNAQPLLQLFDSAGPEQKAQIIESAREIIRIQREGSKEVTLLTITPDRSELLNNFVEAMKSAQPTEKSSEDQTWSGPTPEEENELRRQKIGALEKMIQDPQVLIMEKKRIVQTKTKENIEPILREFLLDQYKGHCQVCNELLDLGSHKNPYFEIYRLDEKRNLHGEWSNQEHNVICLCPNCHALIKYGGRDLSEILEKAKNIHNGETAPEPVAERSGDFYVVNIIIAGKQRHIFYSPVHMASLIAFLVFGRRV